MIKNKDKGITLIALVITIIVLLILAGVAISMLSGENGILKKAADAKLKTAEAQKQEETTLKDYELISNFIMNNAKYKSKHGFITEVGMMTDGRHSELASNLVKALPEDYSLYEIDRNTLKITGNPISEEDEKIKLKTGMVIKKDEEVVSKVVVFGDLSGDGNIDATDRGYFHAFLMSKGKSKLFPEDESFYMAMDVNHDGIIDSNDRDYVHNVIMSADTDNPIVIDQNVEAKKIEKIVFPE